MNITFKQDRRKWGIMPVKIGWLVENRISYFRYEGDVTVEEVAEASRIGILLLEQSDHELIHSLQDSRFQKSFPSNINVLAKTVREALAHPQMGWLISVGIDNDLIRFVATLVSKLTRTRHRVIADYDEALAFLNKADSSLPDLTNIVPPAEDAYLYNVDSNKIGEADKTS
jgi:hypothetical protein